MTLKPVFSKKPTALLFDLDGTLRFSEPSGDQTMLEQAAELGILCSEECRRKARQWAHEYWANSEYLRLDLQTYGESDAAFWENYTRRTLEAMQADPQKIDEWAVLLQQFMIENYHPEDVIPPDVFPTLQALRTAGFTVGLVTNRTRPAGEYLQESGFTDAMDFTLTAGEVGVGKPHPLIFQRALEIAQSQPTQTLYIGDNYFADVVGARRAGLQPVLIDREGIFPDADCPVIHQIAEILPLVGVDQ